MAEESPVVSPSGDVSVRGGSRPSVTLVTTWTYPGVGGVSTHMSLLARGLGIADADVIGFSRIAAATSGLVPRVERAIRQAIGLEGITVHARGLMRIIAPLQTDIVHCHDAMATWACGRARRQWKKPFRLVSTVHGPVSRHMVERGSSPDDPDVRAVQACEHEAWQMADAMIAVDTTQKQILIEQGADESKVTVIANAVDVPEIDGKLRLFGLPKPIDAPWIVVPRQLAPKNGVTYAIRAAALLRRPFRMLIAGEGIEMAKCQELIAKEGLQDRVVLLGAVPRDVVILLYSASAAVVIPSVPFEGVVEATSIAALEAMACGVPVIASGIGGLKEMITDGETGILVSPASPEELADAMTRVLNGSYPVNRVVENAKRRVQERHSMRPWLEAHRAVYRKAIGG